MGPNSKSTLAQHSESVMSVFPDKKVHLSASIDADIYEWVKEKKIPHSKLINDYLRYLKQQDPEYEEKERQEIMQLFQTVRQLWFSKETNESARKAWVECIEKLKKKGYGMEKILALLEEIDKQDEKKRKYNKIKVEEEKKPETENEKKDGG